MSLPRVAMVSKRRELFVDASTRRISQVRDRTTFIDNDLCARLLGMNFFNPHKNTCEMAVIIPFRTEETEAQKC